MDEIKRKLKELKDNNQLKPDSVWVSNNKRVLLSRIGEESKSFYNNKISEQNKFSFVMNIFVPQRMAAIAKPTITFVLVMAVATSGWALTASASNSVKGDLLYSAKRAAEDITVAVTPDKKKKAELHFAHASKRTEETKKIIEKNIPGSKKLAEETLNDLKTSIASAKEAVEEVKSEAEEKGSKKDLVEMAKNITKKTDEIVDSLVDTAKKAEESGVSLQKEVLDAKKEVDKAGLEAVEVVVKAQAEDPSISSNEVKEMVEKKIVKVLTGADEAIAETGKVKELAEQAQGALKEGTIKDGEVDNNKIEEIKNSSSTSKAEALEEKESSIETIEVVVDEIVKEADENKNQVSTKAEELKVLLEQNQITEALQKAKELQEATADSQSTAIEAKKVVGVVLPPADKNSLPSGWGQGSTTSTDLLGEQTTTTKQI